MEVVLIAATNSTPKVELNLSKRVMHISGRSMPEDAVSFYTPIIDWFTEYSTQPLENMSLEIHLEYFNTASSKCLMDIFNCIAKAGNGNIVNWYYYEDDDGGHEAGDDFVLVMGEAIHLIEKKG